MCCYYKNNNMDNNIDLLAIKNHLINIIDGKDIIQNDIITRYKIKQNKLTSSDDIRVIYKIHDTQTNKKFLFKINIDNSKKLMGNKVLKNLNIYGVPILYDFYDKDKDKDKNKKIGDIAVVQYMRGEDMFEIFKKYDYNKKFNEKRIKEMAYNLCKIVKELHSNNIIHCDIKPENVVYDEFHNTISLIDFDMAGFVNQITKNFRPDCAVGTPGFVCPDSCFDCSYDFKSDIFSLGVTLYEFSTRQLPYAMMGNKYAFNNLKINTYIIKELDFSTDFIDLIKKMLSNKVNRIDINQVLSHKWFNEFNTNN